MSEQPLKSPPKPRPKLVRATAPCFIDNRLRQPGEVFETTLPIEKDGPFVDANEEVAPPRPRKTPKATRAIDGNAGVPAPEWTTQGFREQNNIDGPIGMQPGQRGEQDTSIPVTPP